MNSTFTNAEYGGGAWVNAMQSIIVASSYLDCADRQLFLCKYASDNNCVTLIDHNSLNNCKAKNCGYREVPSTDFGCSACADDEIIVDDKCVECGATKKRVGNLCRNKSTSGSGSGDDPLPGPDGKCGQNEIVYDGGFCVECARKPLQKKNRYVCNCQR